MKISIEISKYPLTQEYEQPILQFIERLHQHPGLEVHTNTMSTQVFGDFHQVMEAVQNAMFQSFTQVQKSVLVMKFINADLRP